MNRRYFILVVAAVFILIGVVGIILTDYYYSSSYSNSYASKKSYSTNGERIYFTAVGKNGSIPFRGGPAWLRMHGGSCASCHGVDGRGDVPIMMSSEEAPDISYDALTKEEHGDSDNHEDEEEEHPPYNRKLIKRAITDGLDPAGKPLDLVMPRWDMTEKDFDDLVGFLKTL